ncbi:3-hydroxybutyrate oligomer hydrolase family protein [Streptomyces sp. IB2014 016-6]|uniref:3-hydroxybutyrate oligomer hydrolase family protein n=1 Tax=Streptomyces sp. IB2014 016-6 TaxID=2517818 RepID=UPI0011C70867|nr:3-hydroxybutyrate oligomer hydrolase family protein [Streptomyces sp. IB2014 016-6]TXL88409.1 tannase/feruloyl esterase family alpha/beta hydrolase [Streptomyces sp. IB2014 016-6]
MPLVPQNVPPVPPGVRAGRVRSRWIRATCLAAAALTAIGAAPAGPVPAGADTGRPGHCARADTIVVPGAEHQQAACLDELTTAGTVASGHTDEADWAGLTPKDLATPSGVPGIQLDGYFPDSSTTNTSHGWNHDSQFVIRLPDRWNGGLVIAGSPGVRKQYANDRAFGDWVLARGYAYAATDKGNTGATFHRDGSAPGDALAEWNRRVTQLNLAAREVAAQRYQRPVTRTLAMGMSNGGYLVRWQLENHPELYDGGVDWEGTLWRTKDPNPLTFLPPTLRAYAAGGAGAGAAHRKIVKAGFPAGSEFLWPYHHQYYWDLTQRIYREELDPGYDGAVEAGTPFCTPGTPACDADYDYESRPGAVRDAIEKIELTGRIGKPLISFHGTLDVLLPISKTSDTYARMVRQEGRGALHRYYRVEGGTHVDSLFDTFPDRLRPLVPCHRSAVTALERWLDDGRRPPPSRTLPLPEGADPATLLTRCPLGG